MYYLYVDESGDAGFKFDAGSTPHFIVAGVLVPTWSWTSLQNRYRSMRETIFREHDIAPYEELKGGKLVGTRGSIDGKSRKYSQRYSVYKQCLNLLRNSSDLGVRVFGIHIRKPEIYSQSRKDSLLYYSFEWLFQRYENFLDQALTLENNAIESLLEHGNELGPLSEARSRGMVFCDETSQRVLAHVQRRLRNDRLIPSKLHEGRHVHHYARHVIIEDPVMKQSDLCPYTQMADWVATAYRVQDYPTVLQKDAGIDAYCERFLRPVFLQEAAAGDVRKQGLYSWP